MRYIGNETMGTNPAMIFRLGNGNRLFPGKDIVENQIALMNTVDAFVADLLTCQHWLLESAFAKTAYPHLLVFFVGFGLYCTPHQGCDFFQRLPFCAFLIIWL